MKILIDARLYGLENAGLGRYVINLIKELVKIDSKNEYVIFLRKKYFNNLDLPSNWTKVLVDFHHYSFLEQTKLPGLVKSYKPDVVHFPHFNVPVFFKGNYVLTIHDMLMHKYAGLSATTLPIPLYFLKHLIYKFVFKNAVYKARYIIVPSHAVKKEILEYYKINSEKLKVIYE